MSKDSYILMVFEGQKTEPQILENLKKYFLNESDKKIVKIDCEGSEYEIFDQLDKNNQITTFDYYLIEWHIKGPKQITDILLKPEKCHQFLNASSKQKFIDMINQNYVEEGEL